MYNFSLSFHSFYCPFYWHYFTEGLFGSLLETDIYHTPFWVYICVIFVYVHKGVCLCVCVSLCLCAYTLYALLFYSESIVANHGLFRDYESVIVKDSHLLLGSSPPGYTILPLPGAPAIYQWPDCGRAGVHLAQICVLQASLSLCSM